MTRVEKIVIGMIVGIAVLVLLLVPFACDGLKHLKRHGVGPEIERLWEGSDNYDKQDLSLLSYQD